MSEYTPRHHPAEEYDQLPASPEGASRVAPRGDKQRAVPLDPERLPPSPGIWIVDDIEDMYGTWIDASAEPEALREQIAGKHIFETYGFGEFLVEPGEDPEVISRIARGIAERGPAFAAWAELHDADAQICAAFEDHFLGRFNSYADLGRNLIEASGWSEQQIPEPVRPWVRIDYDAAARHEIAHSRLLVLGSSNDEIYLFSGPE